MKQVTESTIYWGGTGDRMTVYYDATNFFVYYCDAILWDTAKNVALRRVKRLKYTDGSFGTLTDVCYANGGEFNNLATNLATVGALTYPL